MNTILSQLTVLIENNELKDNIFYIDSCPSNKSLEGVRFKFLSINSEGIKLVNTADDCIEVVDKGLMCVAVSS